MIELRHLRYFLEVAKQQHVTRAAETLHITQSTLSHQLHQLEEHLGTPLFDRVGRGLQLTEAGETFMQYAARALLEVEAGQFAIDELHSLARGRLRIGVIDTYTNTLLPSLIARFAQTYPGIHMVIDDLPASLIEQKVAGGELDIGIAFAPTTRPDVLAEPLFSEELVLVVRDDHPYAQRRRIHASDLGAIPVVVQTARFSSRGIIDQNLGSFIKGNIRLEMGSIRAMLHTVRLGDMAAIVFERAVQDAQGLVKVPIQPKITRTAAIIWPQGRSRSAAAGKFASAIADGASQWAE